MAQPVWVLSVDLQTKTATFQSGMAEAARSARGAFTDIKSGSGEMGREVSGNMMEARHGVMLLGEEFGIHLPRALTTFIASIGPIGAAMEAAFPFLAVAVGATLLIEALVKVHEAGEKLTDDQVKFGTAVQSAFNSLDQKLLQAGIRADELRNDHLGALAKQLQLIDMQSMDELEKTFGELAKSADVVFADLKSHWYTFGIGSVGAKHALDEFQIKYDSLLARGKDREASDLLRGTRDSAQKVLEAMNTANTNKPKMGTGSDEAWAANLAYGKAMNVVKQAGLEGTEKELAAQKALVDTLNAQVEVEGKIGQLKKQEGDNAKTSTAKDGAAQASAAARAAADSALRINEQKLAADRALANAQLTMTSASADEREAVETAFADRELQIRLQANTAQIAALDKFAKDYPNQLKALHAKAEELEQQHAAQVTEIQAKSQVANNAESLQALEQGIRESIEATQKGTAARLAAIDAGIAAERSRGLQSASSFRDLENQRVQTIQQMTEEENKLKAEAAKQSADHDLKMSELELAAKRQYLSSSLALTLMSGQARLDAEHKAVDEEYAIKKAALDREMEQLNKHDKEYLNKQRALYNQLAELEREHANQAQSLDDKADADAHSKLTAAQTKMVSEYTDAFSQVIMGKESMGRAMQEVDSQIASAMLKNALMHLATLDMTKEREAAAAARKAFVWGWDNGGPAAVVLAPVMAAGAFAAAMAFEGGGIVPGIGNGDTVPAMLTPGEAVLPKGLTEALVSAAAGGGLGGGTHYHTHVRYSPTIHAIDGDSVSKMLDKHGDKFQRHLEGRIRRLNT